MLQDLSTDRHTAWQLQNGASMQPSDFASSSCFIEFAISLCLFRLVSFFKILTSF